MNYILTIILLLFSTILYSQINIDENISKLIDTSIIVDKTYGVNGYKIQIHIGHDRERAEEIKKRFIKYYPKIKTEYIQEAPYYKILVGEYYSKIKAYRNLKKIKKKFRNSYIKNVRIK